MKKFLVILFCILSLVYFSSCHKSVIDKVEEPQTVLVSFDYSFESGSMTKSDNLYNQFYNEIISKELVADNFNIILEEVNTGEIYEFSGKWKDKDMISIKTGKYKVNGNSIASGNYIQSKCSLKFNTEIEIKSTDTTIVLPAEYNCFLLIFNKTYISTVLNNYYGYNEDRFDSSYWNIYYLIDKDSVLYAFSYNLYDVNHDKSCKPYLKIVLKNNSIIKIYTETINFELGKYYIYNSVDNNFSIPEMTQGNI